MTNWRGRLREAIYRSGKKHSMIAKDAGITFPSDIFICLSAPRAMSVSAVRLAPAVRMAPVRAGESST